MYQQTKDEQCLQKIFLMKFLVVFCLIISGCAGTKKEFVTAGSVSKPLLQEEVAEDGRLSILRKDSTQQIFRDYGVNPTISTTSQDTSTFSMDVDTVSYQIVQESLERYQLPNKAAIRVEEFVNYFDYSYRSNQEDFAVSAEIIESPFRPGFHLLHLGVKAKDVPLQERLPANLVFIADVSGSMQGQNKIGLQKKAFTTLVSQLRSDDKVAIVAYSDAATVVLEPTMAKNKSKIYKAIKRLEAGGGTNAAEGLREGYKVATEIAYPGYINRVILTSDGLANIGPVSPEQILNDIKEHRQKKNIFLTTVGVGSQMYNDYLLEQLANQGNGNYLYFADDQDIQSAFVDGLTTQLQTVAKDAKINVSFNQSVVSHFRQLGYENRQLESQDFLDASKDGGEIGANQQITALYEIKLKNTDIIHVVADIGISYKKPQGEIVQLIKKTIPSGLIKHDSENALPDTIVAMSSAAFAEKLRQSYWSRLYQYRDIQTQLNALPNGQKRNSKVRQLLRLIARAKELDSRLDPFEKNHPINRIGYEQIPLLK